MPQTYNTSTDAYLLEEAGLGNEAAFAVLFERYFHKLHRFALKHLRDECVAEELVMDLMVNIWNKRKQLRPEISIAPYLYRALRNAIIDCYRQQQSPVLFQDELPESSAADTDADHAVHAKELNAWYLRQLNSLPVTQRTAFQLSRDEGLSYPQIAAKMNVSVKAVEKYISKTLVNLRKKFQYGTNCLIIFLISLIF
ncbi:RNA polymerase sigma-70 factor, ECF subfamily [Parapedobacter composti]|uniref:RNA polymerase sigma-70 factor, ECF subfamily n=1 Tax=Parapedobacter composti TaxID=623281 RepID=A0A1I1KPA1_9SPHI|nr:RNA polymerase sigma-70 factor [Parapedobacter composti]SFC62597.1 RNA polymerase sigma-70 factor, ECF subfamily [Parapedobacter composti]